MATDIPVKNAPGKAGSGLILSTSPITAANAFIAGASIMEFFNDGNVILIVDNQQDAAGVDVGFTMPNYDALDITDPSTTQALDTIYMYGPFPPEFYNDSSGKVQLTLSATTTVFVAAIQT